MNIEDMMKGILVNGKRYYFIVVNPTAKKGKYTIMAYDKKAGKSIATVDIKEKDITNIEAITKIRQELINKLKKEK